MACAFRGPSAQLVPTPVPTWQVMPKVADQLAKKYRETQTDSLSLEYVACLRYAATDHKKGERFYLLTDVRFPRQSATIHRDDRQRIVNYTVRARCDADEIHLHTHSRAHCKALHGAACTDSTKWMYPSGIDTDSFSDEPLAFVQYGERHYFGYWPDSMPASALRPPDRKRP